MKGRTILILFLMLAVVLITSAVGSYQDQDDDQDNDQDKDKRKIKDNARNHSSNGHNKHDDDAKNKHSTDIVKGERTIDASNLTGASGAGMSHKVSQSYLDTSVKANGPYVDDGTNSYKGKARGYTLHDNANLNDSDSGDSGDSGDSDSNNSDSGDSNNGDSNNESDFTRKFKYIKKTIYNLFKEIFSKWGNQGSIMAPSGIEELNPDPIAGLGVAGTLEGLTVRDKLKKQARQGMRKVRNAFRSRR